MLLTLTIRYIDSTKFQQVNETGEKFFKNFHGIDELSAFIKLQTGLPLSSYVNLLHIRNGENVSFESYGRKFNIFHGTDMRVI